MLHYNAEPDLFEEDEKQAYAHAHHLGYDKEITQKGDCCRCQCGESKVMIFENTENGESIAIGICPACQ